MTSPISALSSIATSFPTPGVSTDMSVGTTTDTTATQGTGGTDFASVLASSMDSLQATQSNADSLALQAATGDLKDVHDYMIASNEASLATQMTVAIKNKAVDAFNQIMGMPV
jgi:flagellar hook-basal body complex protein FliE